MQGNTQVNTINTNVEELLCNTVQSFFGTTPTNKDELVRQATVYLSLLNREVKYLMPMKDITSTDYKTAIAAFHQLTQETGAHWKVVLEVANYAFDHPHATTQDMLHHYFTSLPQGDISPHAIMVLRLLYCHERCFSQPQDRQRCFQTYCHTFQTLDQDAFRKAALTHPHLAHLHSHLSHAFCMPL